MHQPAGTEHDPLSWCLAITAAFALLVLFHLWIPSRIYFDEVHYVNASRKLLKLIPFNREHPMFAKEMIASFIYLFGDRPFVWRLPSAIMGTAGLFAFGRLVWLSSGKRLATILAMVLLATNFMWFTMSRIAMLDMVSAGMGMIGLWQFAAALKASGRTSARLHLAATAITFGLSLGAKWSIAPALAMPGLAFLVLRMRDTGLLIVGKRGAGPIPGVSMLEATFWLGLLPLAVYWLTFVPEMFYAVRPVSPFGFIAQHEYMFKLQDSVKKLHPYRSVWYEWVGDWRSIWFLYEKVDGAQRGIVMIGNPATMWLGLPALIWSVWTGFRRLRLDLLALVTLYLSTLLIWAINGKPIQFYYHYLLPGAFLAACLALALDALWRRGGRWRWAVWGAMLACLGIFAWFYPILSAMPLCCKSSFAFWMWLPSWR